MGKTVLIVEDEADQRKMIKILLGVHGYEVIEAEDGYEAVEKAVEDPPDLIMMDMAMPILGGIDAVRAIRSHTELEKVPIVAITGYEEFYEVRAREAGCTDVLRKPLDLAQLRLLVESYTS